MVYIYRLLSAARYYWPVTLVAIYPVLFLFAHNIGELSFDVLIVPCMIMVVVSFALCAAVWAFARDRNKTIVLSFVYLASFWGYGTIYNRTQLEIGDFNFSGHRFLFPFSLVIVGAMTLWIIRSKLSFEKARGFIAVFSIVLVAITLSRIAIQTYRTHEVRRIEGNSDVVWEPEKDQKLHLPAGKEPPDIYYIILDGYAHLATLRDVYGFDNRRFEDRLRNKGFTIVEKSRSNYGSTPLSLASSLNMQHVTFLSEAWGDIARDWTMAEKMVQNSRVLNLLKDVGYRLVNFQTGRIPTDNIEIADVNYDTGSTDVFMEMLAKESMLRPLHDWLAVNRCRRSIEKTFDTIPETAKSQDRPTFVLAHLLCPHPPYVFDADGSQLEQPSLEEGDGWSGEVNRDLYLRQLQYINKKVESMIDSILANSRTPPIIIIQADHGPCSTINGHYIHDVYEPGGWADPSDVSFKERYRIFNAIYLPQDVKSNIYPSLTPVNTFRVIFNACFGTNYPLEEDRVYHSTYIYLFKFKEITDRVAFDS